MREVDVVYLYEHAARELDVACAVAAILEREYRLTVRIVHWPSGFSSVENRIQPSLVVLPYCYAEENFTFLLAKWRKARFFNASWEQLFYAGNRVSKTPRGAFAMRRVIHHAWGNQYAKFLNEQGVPSENIFINGQPSYGLYEEPYRRYFASRNDLASSCGLDASRKWLFYPENYNWAFYSDAKLAYFIEQGQSPDDVNVMREFCKSSLAVTLQWCAHLAETDEFEIVIRPRPSTSLKEFLHAARQTLPKFNQHFHVIQEGTVREWILASDMVISSYSTALIEAAIAGKPSYMLEPFPVPGALYVEWHDLLPHIRTYDEFVSYCTGQTASDDALARWAKQTVMSEDAIRRMANFIAHMLQQARNVSTEITWSEIAPTIGYRLYLRLRNAYRWVRYILGIPKLDPIPSVYVKDVKTPEEIDGKITRWLNLLYGHD